MFTIISFFQKLIKGVWSNKGVGGLENFSKINKRGGGTIIRYSRVDTFLTHPVAALFIIHNFWMAMMQANNLGSTSSFSRTC